MPRTLRAVLALTLVGSIAFFLPVTPVQADGFEGDCTTETPASSGTCTIDEPMGSNPAVHGTVDWQRTTTADDDDLAFTINPAAGDTVTEIQLCITAASAAVTENPYVPTAANTCAGDSDDRVLVDESDPPLELSVDLSDALGSGFTNGGLVWFALHINIHDPAEGEEEEGDNRTTYVVGNAVGETRSLTVAKDVVGESDASFSFIVDCSVALTTANNATATYDADGDATVLLQDGGSASFTGLAPGTTCEVTEANPGEGWTTTTTGGSNEDEDRTVEVALAGDDVTVTFQNTPPSQVETTTLTVAKDVVGTSTATFTFTVDCSVALGTANNATATYDADGDATVALSDGGTAVFTGVPVGTTCTVTEADPGTGWTTTTSGGSNPDGDRTVDVTLGSPVTVTYANTPPAVVGGVVVVNPTVNPTVNPVVQPTTTPLQVAGVQAQRLPETGPTDLTWRLAALGGALVLAGALLRLGARPRRRA